MPSSDWYNSERHTSSCAFTHKRTCSADTKGSFKCYKVSNYSNSFKKLKIKYKLYFSKYWFENRKKQNKSFWKSIVYRFCFNELILLKPNYKDFFEKKL